LESNKIKLLYALQKIDLELMDLEELKGDLPSMVNRLTEESNALTAQIDELQHSFEANHTARENATLEAESLSARIDKLKKQLYTVRNNKEYDAITREITKAEDTVLSLLKEYDTHEESQKELRTRIDAVQEKLAGVEKELEENRRELKAVSKSHEDEEKQLLFERESLVRLIDRDMFALYERIRKAKDGRAIVAVRRGACGGCYKTVSPQLNLLLRKNEEMYICENCGRILISEDIAAGVNKVA
jgi:uncharacterized protein